MRLLFGIIVAAIAIQVAVSMVPGINTTLQTITTPTYSAGTVGIFGVLLMVFGAGVAIGLLKSMLGDLM